MATEKSMLRIVTTGSVDDGKSTLMGRLLFDTHSVLEDQYKAIQGRSNPQGEVDLSLLLDGLSAEREQAITIDVAYRYFETRTRKFILADSPGHEQYTRNMVTGASTADCAMVLIDARHGVVTQSRRHGFILSLLQVPHVVVVVNKMDQVDYDPAVYQAIVDAFEDFARRLDLKNLTFIPVCALHGDHVVHRSDRMAWHKGPTLLEYLESVHLSPENNLIDFRFPVQGVIRPDAGFRGFAGRIVSGTIRPGEEVTVLPSGHATRIKSIETYGGPLEEAYAPQSVTLTLRDEVDVSRGCMLARPGNLPQTGTGLDAAICWMDETPLDLEAPYLLKHTTQTVKARVRKVAYRFNVETLHREPAPSLGLNEIGRIEIETTLPIFFDPYKLNRSTGSFILIDAITHRTVAAGMIRKGLDPDRASGGGLSRTPSQRLFAHEVNLARGVREARNGHGAAVVWLTGLSGSGKSTLGRAFERTLHGLGCQTMLLDGDALRQGLCSDLGFTPADRTENIRRAGEVARLFFEAGHLVICAFISPQAGDRAMVRSLIGEERFYEVHVSCPLEVCVARDPNGLYGHALTGQIPDFTGISAAYEAPSAPDLVLQTDQLTLEQSVDALVDLLKQDRILPEAPWNSMA